MSNDYKHHIDNAKAMLARGYWTTKGAIYYVLCNAKEPVDQDNLQDGLGISRSGMYRAFREIEETEGSLIERPKGIALMCPKPELKQSMERRR